MATPTQTKNASLGIDIQARLAQLRRRIKMYVWVEGLSLAFIWLGLTFWAGLAIDYLPVLVGASEMPRAARIVLLTIIAAVLAYVIYRWIIRRAFIRMPDHSMAVLLERRFGHFHDSLVTAVELSEQPGHAEHFNQAMLAHTRQEAQSQTADIRVGEVFRLSPLVTKMVIAVALLVPIGVFYAVNASAATTWMNRLYLLADQPWPRSTHLVVAGIQIQRAPSLDGETALSKLIPFGTNREIKVAKGTSLQLKVKADATKVIPEYCSVYYQTMEGDRGKVVLRKLGRIRDNYQMFVCDSKPFHGILSTITFDVRGLDHRVRDYRLTVVPSPVIVETQLDCVFPDYMVNEQLSLWLPRTIELASGSQLPMGTHITLRSRVNKNLTKVAIRNVTSDETTTLDIPRQDGHLQQDGHLRQFQFTVDQLQDNLSLEITLHDTDGVVSDPPIRLYIAGIEDQGPVVKAILNGIGTAVTPNVVIPAKGEISDDYDVARSWFEVIINDSTPREFPFPLDKLGAIDAKLDFRAERATRGGAALKPKDKLSVTVMAADKCDLRADPNIGSGDRYQLDVVSAEELITMLERKELGLRRRLEQIIDELNEMRDSVSRMKRSTGNDKGNAPEDERKKAAADTAAETATAVALGNTDVERAETLRLLRSQRSRVQCDKSAQEVLGVAASFADIREELINNRVDSKDRQSRLKEQIADPLRLIGKSMFPQLALQLKDIEQKLADPTASDAAVDLAVDQADTILLELDKVLQKILELETFSELMNIVRSLIEDQQELIDKAKQKRKKGALDLLK